MNQTGFGKRNKRSHTQSLKRLLLSNNPSNLISLSFFNDAGIYYDNEQQVLYNKAS